MSFRDALQAYLDYPEKHKDLVLFADDDFVIIKDLYPKSTFHYLILPKLHTHEHPLHVFKENVDFYRQVENYVGKAKEILRRNLIHDNYFKNADGVEIVNNFVKVGVHSVPSLRNLHIHLISKDFHSPRLKNRKHYNSFNTDFFVDFDKLRPGYGDESRILEIETDIESGTSTDESDSKVVPASEKVTHLFHASSAREVKIKTAHLFKEPDTKQFENYLKAPLICLYCGRNFANKFSSLKVHLKQEFLKKFASE